MLENLVEEICIAVYVLLQLNRKYKKILKENFSFRKCISDLQDFRAE